MRLLYLANKRLPTEKAYGIQIVSMCEAFSRFGSDVELAAPSRRGAQGNDPLAYYDVIGFRFTRIRSPEFYPSGKLTRPAFWLRQGIGAFQLAWFALRRSADVVYTRDEGVAILTALIGRNTALELHSFSPGRRILYWFLKVRGVKLVCITKGLADRMVHVGFRRDGILVAPDGFDPKLFETPIPKDEARRQNHLPADIPIVLYAGHLYPWKGADVLAQAASMIDGIVVFVGGTDADITKFKALYGSTSNIMFVGHRPHNEIPTWLWSADVLVLPNMAEENISRLYTSPLKMFEYMASGVPIVASGLPSIREVLNEKNAVLVPPGDPALLGRIVGSMLKDPKGDPSKRAKQDVEHYSWFARAQRVIDFIRV